MLKKILLLACAGFAVPAVSTQLASAQDSTTGAISGVVKDSATGEKLAGVTVVVTSAQRKNDYTAISDGGGKFKIGSLPPGDYAVVFIFAEAKSKIPSVRVNVGRSSQLYPKINLANIGETVVIKGRPNIDTTKTTQGIVIDRTFIENLPIPGGSFESTLAIAAGAQDDGVGVSFSGSSSLENQYVVDGVNTTGLGAGTVGSPISNEFVEETEVITGGYMAEHGRSTGGVVNVTTRVGTNDFHGTVFTFFTNSLLQKRNSQTPIQSWIDVERNLAYDSRSGATLGGPIIKDKLWFFVGIQPRFIANDTDRIIKRQTDCRSKDAEGNRTACVPGTGDGQFSDGTVDEDDNGFIIYEELDRNTLTTQTTEYQFVTKLNYSPNPENAGQITLSGTPIFQESAGLTGEAQAVSRDAQVLTTDVSAKWTSKFNDAKTTVDATFGMHRNHFTSGSIDPRADDEVQQTLLLGNFGLWAQGTNSFTGAPRESAKVIAGCVDSQDTNLDPYQLIDNCPDPGTGYSIGGIGFLADTLERRLSAKLAVTQRVKAAGDHEFKVGVDFENNFRNRKRKVSGGARVTTLQDRDQVDIFRFVSLQPEGDTSGNFPDECPNADPMGDPLGCKYDPPGDIKGETVNFAGFAQDSWQILPNLTINAGIRYEEQRLRNAEHIIGTRAQGTGQLLGKNAMVLSNMWAPRLGAIYDWTKEGRSKVYGSWGRYYESLPMTINDRSFGAESNLTTRFDTSAGACGGADDNTGGINGVNCLADGVVSSDEFQNGSGVLVASGVKAQFLDEAILGVEYEIMEDLKVGISYKNRRLGRVLEDLSTDNAVTYILANPGEWSAEEERKLEARIESESDPDEKDRLTRDLAQFKGIRQFDNPRRDYNAVEVTASKRFSQRFFVQSSYVYSRTEGNYQGLFSSTNGQIDPNITSLFDLPELMANRDGNLPQDRPHFFKLDGAYTFDFKKAGELTTGMSFRALSGTPTNATGAHYRYGQDETLLLPAGSRGRVAFNYNASIHVGYKRDLGKGMQLEGFLDLFNLNAFEFVGGQGTASVDQTYSFSSVNPVVGGKFEDLIYLKELNQTTGAETAAPQTVLRNKNFGQTRGLYAAPSARLGARLTF